MKNVKDYNKSICLDSEKTSKKDKVIRKNSCELLKNKKLKEENAINIFKNKLKKVDKNKFKNIPKNNNLDFSSILYNNCSNNNYCRRKKFLSLNVLNNLQFKDEHFYNNTNIKREKFSDNNLKISSLIPISRKNNKSKRRTIKDKEIFLSSILKEVNKNPRKVSFYDDNNSKSTKKKGDRKYNSSNELFKVMKKNRISSKFLTKFKEVENVKNLIKDEKKIKNKKKNKEEENCKEKKIDKMDIISDKNEKKISEKKSTKKLIINKDNENIDLNNATKNENEIEKNAKKAKKKKHKGFPFCCLTINDDNSSDDE